MNHDALADRINNYCDGLAAFSLVNALAFVVTLADPDIRCSIAAIAGLAVACSLFIALLITLLLLALRRFERSLRPADSDEPRIARFWQYVQAVRLVLVWGVALLATFGSYAATLDPRCSAAAEVALR